MITTKNPESWKDLQNMTAEILSESWLIAETEKIITSVRGDIEIDVFAIEKIHQRENIILIECKFWSKPIPQTVIHSFRTVVWDIWGNTWYIISKKGFQSWSYKAIQSSNIRLVTWIEFISLFEDQWYNNYFNKYLRKHFDLVIELLDTLVPSWAIRLIEKNDIERIKFLRLKYKHLGRLLYGIIWSNSFFSANKKVSLPLINNFKLNDMPQEILNTEGYKELIFLLHKHYNPLINEIYQLKEKAYNN